MMNIAAKLYIKENFTETLIHAAYTQNGCVTVDRWKNRVVLSNPGTMLVSVDQFFVGNQSVCRNPLLQHLFVQLGVGEKAGSGADVIVQGWKDNGWSLPLIGEKNRPDRVEMTLYLQKDAVSTAVSTALNTALSTALSWKQVKPMFEMLSEPNFAKDIMAIFGLKDVYKFKKKYLDPFLAVGILSMTQPDKPTSSMQKYYLTDLGKQVMEWKENEIGEPTKVSQDKINRFLIEMQECINRYPVALPEIKEEYKTLLQKSDVRCFKADYKHQKEIFEANQKWIYNMPDLYLEEIQNNIWRFYNTYWLLRHTDNVITIRFSEIKDTFARLELNEQWAVVTSFRLDTYDKLYGGEAPFEEMSSYRYSYKGMNIYRIPAHNDFMIIMKANILPRYEIKEFESENSEFKLIDKEHKIYSNLLNMKDMDDSYGLSVMRDIRFYYPNEEDFHYIRLQVDRMEDAKEVN